MKRRNHIKVSRCIFIFILIVVVGIIFIRGGNLIYQHIKDDGSSPVMPSSKNILHSSKKQNPNAKKQVYKDLEKLVSTDNRIQTILDSYEKYPESLLKMLSKNLEMLDYVLDYIEKKDTVYAKTIGKVKQGEFSLLLQWDKRWGYARYGDGPLAVTGCAPTALSMVISGLTGKANITPSVIAAYAEKNGYYINGIGSDWSLISDGCQHFGVIGTELQQSKDAIFESLQNGHPIICSMHPGDFTTTGHFIVLAGIENGKIRVLDSNSKERSEKLWDYATLEKQIFALWTFSLL